MNVNNLTLNTMSVTNTMKELYEDQFREWIEKTKHSDMEQYFTGEDCRPFIKDNYEICVEQYMEDKGNELWNEFLDTLPEL